MERLELDKASILDVIVSLLADELKTLRHLSTYQVGSEHWDASTLLGEIRGDPAPGQSPLAIGADSLELLSLATSVAKFFNVYDSGLEDYLLRFKTLGEWADLVVTARQRGSQDLTFSTSGSTGSPKQCAQRWHDLLAEASYLANYLASAGSAAPRRIIALSPCHHIYGFIFSVLLAQQLRVPVIRGVKALAMANQRTLQSGDLLIGFPFIFRQLSRDGAEFPAGITAVTSTGPCEAAIIRQLQRQGIERMIEVYGSSETAGVGLRSDPDGYFKLLPRWQRGEQPDTLRDAGCDRVCQLNDRLEWSDDSHFRPAGRLDEAVQVAGINVFPMRISERLQALPQVAAAAVRLMSAQEGERLKAFIVPAAGYAAGEQLESLLHAWCAQNLPAVERPKAFTFGSALPHSHLGKLSDWSIGSGDAG